MSVTQYPSIRRGILLVKLFRFIEWAFLETLLQKVTSENSYISDSIENCLFLFANLFVSASFRFHLTHNQIEFNRLPWAEGSIK